MTTIYNRLHSLALKGLTHVAPMLPEPQHSAAQSVSCMALDFPNAFGIAAGADKNGEAVFGWYKMGFGFAEIGTVLPRPYQGNPPPNLRRVSGHSIVNSLGFPSQGAASVLHNFQAATHKLNPLREQGHFLVGINCSKHPQSALAESAQDCLHTMEILWHEADYFTVNISSPNSPGLRELQHAEHLQNLLEDVAEGMAKLQAQTAKIRPLALKLSPDMTPEQQSEVAEIVTKLYQEGCMHALILTNTSMQRPDHLPSTIQALPGGLSGGRITELALTVQHNFQALCPQVPVIASGGIMTPDDAQQRLQAGASLVQLYSGLVYNPLLLRNIKRQRLSN